MEKEFIGLKGEQRLWKLFIKKVKKEKTQVWKVLKPCIENYLNKKTMR